MYIYKIKIMSYLSPSKAIFLLSKSSHCNFLSKLKFSIFSNWYYYWLKCIILYDSPQYFSYVEKTKAAFSKLLKHNN